MPRSGRKVLDDPQLPNVITSSDVRGTDDELEDDADFPDYRILTSSM
jgi:hypothetical protein